MAWDDITASVNLAMVAAFKTTGGILYSRPQSSSFNAVAAFMVDAILETGGQYESPTGPMFGEATVITSSVPLGPQKGDSFVWRGVTFTVQELFPENNTGSTKFQFRKSKQ